MEYPETSQVHYEDIENIFDAVSYAEFLANPNKLSYKRFETTDLQLCTKCHCVLIESDELLCEDCESEIFSEL